MIRNEILLKVINKTDDINIENAINMQLSLENAHPRRERCKYFGEELQMDACSKKWTDSLFAHLHLCMDNATGKCVGGYFDNQETLNGYYHVLYQVITNYGLPVTIKTDRRTVFTYLNLKMKTDEKDTLTQFAFACEVLGIELESSSNPEFKSIVERANNTFEDRLSVELKMKNITTIKDANDYLIKIFIPEFNKQFGLKIAKSETAFVQFDDLAKLKYYLSVINRRQIDNGGTLSYKNILYVLMDENGDRVLFDSKTKCNVIYTFNGEIFANVYGVNYVLEPYDKNKNYTYVCQRIYNGKPTIHHNIPKLGNTWSFDKYNKFYNDIRIRNFTDVNV